MNAGPFRAALAALALLASASAPTAQPVGGTPPEDIHVEVSRSQAGIALSSAAITLQKGDYYRLNLACVAGERGDPAFSFDASSLLRDAHLRIVTVDTIEVYLQGLSFRRSSARGRAPWRSASIPCGPATTR